MKKHSLLVVTVLMLGLTGMMLRNAQGSTAHRPSVNRVAANQSVNPCQDPAARAWLQVQPHHWRDCMLQQ